MKNAHTSSKLGKVIAVVFFLFSLFFFLRYEKPAPASIVPPGGKPGESFFDSRNYPDAKYNIQAFENALKDARNQAALRNNTPGFDKNWTEEGPGNMGGRINTVAVHPSNEDIVYVGFSIGGVFKTTDGGASWNPIFDDQLFLAIGHIVIDPNNPETIYVGTGDPNISGRPFIGNGIFKSVDGGQTWQHLGLTEQRIISKIILHPTEPNTIYAATMGLPFERNNKRGLYKTTDGGLTWEQILFVNQETGIIDLVIDPSNPDVIYAAGWNRIRNNSESFVTGLDARIHKTTDGGNTWTILGNGLPLGNFSRTGLAISTTNPQKLYALYVDSTYNLHHVYKTENGGNNWSVVPTETNGLDASALGGFGWYFGKIRINPVNDDEIYILGVDLWRTRDGGMSWTTATPAWWNYEVHADKHDLVFSNTGKMFLATDGGLYRSDDDGSNWMDIENIPANQFYRVAYNPHDPTGYYGGMQDNGTSGGDASMFNTWPRIFGGDGFQPVFHPQNQDIFYVETQNGNIRQTLNGGGSFAYFTNGLSGTKEWDQPYFMSVHDPDILYTGIQNIYRASGTSGQWVAISDDLTDGDNSFNRRPAISALAESTLTDQLLYAGTNDGNLWLSSDAGTNWNEITGSLPNRYITSLETSPNVANRVFVTHSGYKDNDNFPHIHRSDDLGNSWIPIAGNLPALAINSIFIHPERNDSLIFVATDGGVYATIDAGASWERLGNNMPMIPVYDLAWNEALNTLIAGTFGRSIWSYPINEILNPSANPVSVKPVAKVYNTLKIFPSPAKERVTISFSNTEPGKKAEAVIINTKGQVVLNKIFPPDETEINWNPTISHLPSGNYFIKIKIRHQVLSGAFIKL